jgi:hypothetical protein
MIEHQVLSYRVKEEGRREEEEKRREEERNRPRGDIMSKIDKILEERVGEREEKKMRYSVT